MKILIINGPNLNLLGRREPSVYGDESFDSYFKNLENKYPDVLLEYFQSNCEGEIITRIQQAGFSCDGIVLNAGGYTHTSIAIADAIRAVTAPVVELHISNVYAREPFRHTSMLAPACRGCICGFGLKGYDLAIEALLPAGEKHPQDAVTTAKKASSKNKKDKNEKIPAYRRDKRWIKARALADELRAKGLSFRKIAETLNAEGYPTRRNGLWSMQTVRLLLKPVI